MRCATLHADATLRVCAPSARAGPLLPAARPIRPESLPLFFAAFTSSSFGPPLQVCSNLSHLRKHITIPHSVPGLVTKRVLVMNFVDGVPLTEAASKIGEQFFLCLIFACLCVARRVWAAGICGSLQLLRWMATLGTAVSCTWM